MLLYFGCTGALLKCDVTVPRARDEIKKQMKRNNNFDLHLTGFFVCYFVDMNSTKK